MEMKIEWSQAKLQAEERGIKTYQKGILERLLLI